MGKIGTDQTIRAHTGKCEGGKIINDTTTMVGSHLNLHLSPISGDRVQSGEGTLNVWYF